MIPEAYITGWLLLSYSTPALVHTYIPFQRPFTTESTFDNTTGWPLLLYFQTGIRLNVQPLRESVCDILQSHSSQVSAFRCILFMASTQALQLAVAGIQTNNHLTRMLVYLIALRLSVLLFRIVVALTAIGYDYSKQRVSVHVPLRWLNLDVVSPHVPRRGMPHVHCCTGIFVDTLYRWNIFGSADAFLGHITYSDTAAEKALDTGVRIIRSCAYSHLPHSVVRMIINNFQARYCGLCSAMYVCACCNKY